MTKVLISPLNKEMIINNKDYVDGYVIGLNNYTVNYNSFCFEEVINIIDYCNENNKEIFIVLNKNMHSIDIDNLRDILPKFNNINGILFYDNGIISLRDELELNIDLVWSSEHQVTNYETVNFYKKFNINYSLLSSDITLREAFEIKTNTNSKIILPVFGYLPMFVSQRHLIKNYIKKFDLKNISNINYIEKEGNSYPIIDNELGTMVYSNKIYSILDELDSIKKNNIDYILLNSYLINNNFNELVKSVYNNEYQMVSKLYETSSYFKNVETVYKVK